MSDKIKTQVWINKVTTFLKENLECKDFDVAEIRYIQKNKDVKPKNEGSTVINIIVETNIDTKDMSDIKFIPCFLKQEEVKEK